MKLSELLMNNRVKDPRKGEQTVLLKGADLDMVLLPTGYVLVTAKSGVQMVVGPGNVRYAEVAKKVEPKEVSK